ncbi:MAG: glycosyltransferase [Pseudomonadota bacterium]
MQVTVSVIIPVYNGAPFIARAVRSALAQTHRPCEVIVVDDGSTDRTVDQLQAFGARITLISIPNGGVSHARNVGMRASRGELLAFLDADDLWHPDKLRAQVAALGDYPEAGLCCCDYQVFDRHRGRPVQHFSVLPRRVTMRFDRPFVDVLDTLISCNFVGTASTVVLRASLARQVGLFDRAYRQAEDYDYWLRCARLSAFLVLSAELVDKRSHDSNLTNDGLETYACHEQVLLALQRRRQDTPARQRAVRAALARTRYVMGNLLFESGATGPAFAHYVRGLLHQRSPGNAFRFLFHVAKKTVRLLCGDLRRPARRAPGVRRNDLLSSK